MELLTFELKNNEFLNKYMNDDNFIEQFFDYNWKDKCSYEERLKYLHSKNYNRDRLVDVIESYMLKYTFTEEVKTSLKKLRSNDSVVVIGGQQAGLLTGPMYTINKIISIILFAKEQEEKLSVPVVPVFWIAGEDHDYDEVNHVYVNENNKIMKKKYEQVVVDKRMISNIILDELQISEWSREIIRSYGETEHTKELIRILEQALEHSTTITDYFAHLITALFSKNGLLLIDSGNRKTRELLASQFESQIENVAQISKSILDQQNKLSQLNFSKMIQFHPDCAHLFYYNNFERTLLYYDEEKSLFYDKQRTLKFTKEELLNIAKNETWKLSSNVATRPLAQEALFPTLAFIAGPGEVAYWAELRSLFNTFGLKMPPVVPRLMITVIDRTTNKLINELKLNLEELVATGVDNQLQQFIKIESNYKAEKLITNISRQLDDFYRQLYDEITDNNLLVLAKKNEHIVNDQIKFLHERMHADIIFKNELTIRKYERVNNNIRPLKLPQERVFSGVYFMNLYGLNFFHKLMEMSYKFDGKHKVILY